jgi:dTDP-4-dehydrorhamnose reductase
MKIGITGASGMFGSCLLQLLSKKYEIAATSRTKGLEKNNIKWCCFDLTNFKLLEKWLNETKPDVLIHCAAIVNVDYCEENEEKAIALHFETTQVISKYLDLNNSRLIYISTDSVFDGKKKSFYCESDITSPLNIYANTKLMGEKSALSFNNGLVLRTNIVGWTQKRSTSFFEWLLQSLINKEPINLFHDVYFSPISVYDFSLVIEMIIEYPIFGLYHCGARDKISKFEFGIAMSKLFQLSSLNINKISVDDMKFNAVRPKNMALDVYKITSTLDYQMPNSLDCLKTMKRQYDQNNNLLN